MVKNHPAPRSLQATHFPDHLHHGCRQQLCAFLQDDQVGQHTHPVDLQPMPLWTALVDLRMSVLQNSHVSCLCPQCLGSAVVEGLARMCQWENLVAGYVFKQHYFRIRRLFLRPVSESCSPAAPYKITRGLGAYSAARVLGPVIQELRALTGSF